MGESTTMDRPNAKTSERLREQTTKVKEDVRELGRIGKDFSQEKLEKYREKTGTYIDKGREKMKAAEEKVATYVREKPVKSLAIAAGAGALLGFLLRRR